MRARHVVVGTTALGLLTAACGGGRAVQRVAPEERTYLTVTNTNWADVTVFAVRGSTRSRIGFVTALRTRTFLVPRSAMPDGMVRLLIDPLGSDETYLSESIMVAPGQRVEFTVMPAMTLSVLAVSAAPSRGLEPDPK